MTTATPRVGTATGWEQFVASERDRGREADALWHQVLAEGLPFLLERQAENEALGSAEACVYCFRRFGPEVGRNRLNRYYCDDCDTFIRTTPGQTELILPALVVDIRDSTTIERGLGIEWVRAIRRFRREVACTVQRHYGFVMNTGGDSLMAIFPPGFLPPQERDRTSVAAEAIAAAEHLAARSPDRYEEGRLPYGTGVHTSEMVIFSVQGDDDDPLLADPGDPDRPWMPAPADVSGPVSIDMAGEAIVVACELADAAPAGEAFISAETDREAGISGEGHGYEERPSKVGPIRIRRTSGA